MKFWILLFLSVSAFANSKPERVQFHREVRNFDVTKMQRPIIICNVKDLEHYISISPKGQLTIHEFVGLLVEVAFSTKKGAVMIQYHPDHDLFTVKSDKFTEVSILHHKSSGQCAVAWWKSKQLINASVGEIIRIFDFGKRSSTNHTTE